MTRDAVEVAAVSTVAVAGPGWVFVARRMLLGER